MATFLLIAGLGVALGLGFGVTVVLVASSVTLIAVFAVSLQAGAGMPGAVFDAVTGIVALQLGYLAGVVGGSLASSRSRRGDDGVVERPVVAGTAVAMAGAAPSPDLVGPQAPVAAAAGSMIA